MLFVERSNRTESLLEGLAERLMGPGRDPLAPSVVVVQGPGMERWLAQSIARSRGVCANIEFLFPREFIERIVESPSESNQPARNAGWEGMRLVWSVARCLAAGRGEPDFEPLARHLEAADGDWRLVQLAQNIATLLDQYVTFRPDWVRDWCAASKLPEERDARWQARLLRELTAELGPGHLADRAGAFLAGGGGEGGAVGSGTRGSEEVPGSESLDADLLQRFPDLVEIFAVSTLPPLYLSVIEGLSRHRDVHLSVLSPSRSYWADLWREVRDGDLEAFPSGEGEEAPGLFDVGPASPVSRLLAGLGRLGGDFQRCLEDELTVQEGEVERFASPIEGAGAPSLLHRLQAQLLDLDSGFDGRVGDAGDSVDDACLVRSDDDSIQVHLCHGPRRELEVVEAVLRDAFERDPTLTPEDVIVMAPRIDEIAPDIEAVFDVPHGAGHSIPHRIADRGVFQRSPVAEAFRGLLDLLGGRAARSEVLEWLAREPARARFGLDEEAVERLASWGERAGVRFGLDEDHRADLGLARTRAHTWADGLERLALAHAVGASGEVFAGTAPIPLDPFAEPAVLGAIGEVETMLSAAHEFIAVPRPVSQWCGWLADLLEESCDRRDANAHEHTSIRGLLQDISESAVEAGFEERIPFEAIRERVGDGLESSPAPQAFLAGGVTFCELVPLRAIPFRVVAILGMSDDAFPRGRPAPGFDLMARSPRPGDRSTRSDDRYLFLEALLSVRDRLILTVPGQDVRDGSDLPPSIVVTELLDAIEGSFRLESAGGPSPSLRDALVIQHPLQSFSPRYFESQGDSRLLGRDEDAFLGAEARREALQGGGGESRRFLAGLQGAEEASQIAPEKEGAIVSEGTHSLGVSPQLSLNELIERVLRATRYFTRERLSIRLPRLDEVVGDLDPFELPPLEQFSLGSALLDDLEGGSTIEEATQRLMSRASIPAGVPGSLAVRRLQEEVDEVARIGRGRCVGDRLADVEGEVSLDVAGLGLCRLTGRLDGLWSESRVQVGIGRVGRRAELDLWIRHLFLCALEGGGDRPARSTLVGRPENSKSIDHVVDFEPVADAALHLGRLFDWAWSTQFAPLPFFPKSSRAFAERAEDGKLDQAWRAAHQAYHGGDATQFAMPESEEELEHALLWEGVSPLDEARDIPIRFRFDVLASEFFAPLLAARKVHAE